MREIGLETKVETNSKEFILKNYKDSPNTVVFSHDFDCNIPTIMNVDRSKSEA